MYIYIYDTYTYIGACRVCGVFDGGNARLEGAPGT
jgi:hypothetical protein